MVRMLVALFICLTYGLAYAGNQNILVYSGRIVKPNDMAVDSSSVLFNVAIYAPNACLLYSETQTINMSNSKGTFSLNLGNGSRTDGGAHTFAEVFANSGSLTGLTGTGCPGTYSPSASDDRTLVVQFNDGTGIQAMAPQAIKAVPFASNTAALQGIPLNLAGTLANGQVLTYDSTAKQWKNAAPPVGAITSVAGKTGVVTLQSADITDATSANTANMIVKRDASGNFQAGTISANIIGDVTGNLTGNVTGNVSGTAAGFSGTLAGDVIGSQGTTSVIKIQGRGISAAVPNSNDVLTWNGSAWAPVAPSGVAPASTSTLGGVIVPATSGMTIGSGGTLGLNLQYPLAINGSNKLSIVPGTANQILGMDATGTNHEYKTITAGSGVSISESAGTISISAAGTGVSNIGMTVPSYMAVSPASVTSTGTFAVSYNTQTANKIFAGPASGGAAAPDFRLMALLDLPWSVAPGNNQLMLTNGTGSAVSPLSMTSGQMIVGNASGVPSAISMSGDATITALGTVTVAKIQNRAVASTAPADGQLLAWNNSLSQWEPANPAATGVTNVAAGTGITSNPAGSISSVGTLSLDTSYLNANYFKQGGNSFGVAGTIGTADNFDLVVRTNNVARMTVTSGGSVGIGVASPAAKLDVAGEIRFGNTSLTCAVGTAGAFRYNAGTMEFCNGSAWTPLAAGGSGEVNTASNQGAGGVGLYDAKAAADLQFRNINAATGSPVTVTLDAPNKEVDLDIAATSGQLLVGNSSNLARSVAMSGDATITNLGTVTVSKIRGNTVSATAPANGQILSWNNALSQWEPANAAATGVTNIGMTVPSYMAVSPASVTSTGTFAVSYNTQTANKIFAGPASGGAAAPDFRLMALLDLPWSVAPGNNQLMLTNGTGSAVSPLSMTSGQMIVASASGVPSAVSMSGDATITALGTVTVSKIQNRAVASTAPTNGQLLAWNNALSQWEPANAAATGVTSVMAGTGLTSNPAGGVVSVGSLAIDSTYMNANYFKQGGNSFGVAGTIGTADNFDLVVRTNNLARMTVTAAGSVGLGTSTPRSVLAVTAPSAAYNGDGITGVAQFTTGTGATTDEKLQFGIVDGSYSWIQAVKPGTSTRMLALNPSGGNVGVGVTNPTERLDINGAIVVRGGASTTTASTGILDFTSGYTRIVSRGADTSTNGGFRIASTRSDGSNALIPLSIDTSGNVGIGTITPAAKLDVAGEIRFGNTSLACAVGTAGAFRYNAGTMEFCNGSAWTPLAAGGSGEVNTASNQGSSGVGLYLAKAGVDIQFKNIDKATGSPITVTNNAGNKTVDLDIAATSGQLLVGNSSNLARSVAMSGDATITNLGTVTVSKIQNRAVASTAPADGQLLAWNNALSQWEPANAAATGVTNIGMTVPSYMAVSPASVTSTGTFAVSYNTQTANKIFAGPASGGAAAPDFRLMALLDLPWSVAPGNNQLMLTNGTGSAVSPLSMTSGQIILGSASGVPSAVSMSGDATITALGTVTVSKIQNRAVASTAPADGQTLSWNNALSQWEPSTAAAGASSSGTAGHVQFSNGSGGFSSDTNQLFWDATNNRLGVGTNTPTGSVGLGGVLTADTLVDIDMPAWAANDDVQLRVGDLTFNSRKGGINEIISMTTRGSNGHMNLRAGGHAIMQADSNDLNFRTTSSGTQRMVIKNTGEVGIGNITPVALLDVNGDFIMRGAATGTYAVSPASQGRIFYDSTLQKFQVSQNGGAYVDLVSSSAVTGAGTVGKIPKYVGTLAVGDSIMSEASSQITLTNTSTLVLNPNQGGGHAQVKAGAASNLYLEGGNGVSQINLNFGGGINFRSTTAGTYNTFENAAGNVILRLDSGNTNLWDINTSYGVSGNLNINQNGGASGAIVANRAIATTTNAVGAATVDLTKSNTHTLATPGTSTITVSGMQDGAVYNIIIADTATSRTYTFSGCTNSYYKPANAATTVGTRTVYGLMTVKNGANWDCYISWSTGFQ